MRVLDLPKPERIKFSIFVLRNGNPLKDVRWVPGIRPSVFGRILYLESRLFWYDFVLLPIYFRRTNLMKVFRLTSLFIVMLILAITMQCKERKANENNDSNEIENLSSDLAKDTSMLALSADLLIKNGQYHEASMEYSKLIKIDSSNGKFLFRKGYCLTQIDSPFQALKYYIKAAESKFHEAECYYVIGTIHGIEGRDSLAIVYLEKALALEPGMEKAKSFLSTVRQWSQDTSL